MLDGRPLKTLNTSFLNIDPTAVQNWQVSDNLRILVIVFQSGDLLYVDLEQFVKDWSDFLLKEKNNLSEVEVKKKDLKPGSHLHTCHIGDPSWREKLSALHHGRYSERKLNKKRNLLESGGLERRKRFESKPNITGFKSKEKRLSNAVASGPTSIVAPKGLHGYSVEAISIGLSTLTLIYTYNDVSVLAAYTIQTGSWTLQRFV